MQPYCQLPPKEPQPADQNLQNHFLESSHLLKIRNVNFGLFYQSLVQDLHLAFNKTFVVRVSSQKVEHYSAQGEVLRVLDVPKTIVLSFMASPSLVIIITESHDHIHQIIQWDLQAYQTVTLTFVGPLTSPSFSFTFTESQLFCIGYMKQPKLLKFSKQIPKKSELIYFKYPLEVSDESSPSQNPFHRMELNLTKQKVSKLQKIVKINNKSMVGLIANQLSQDQSAIQVLIFELNNQEGICRSISIKHSLQIDWKIYSIRVADIYQIEPQKIYVKLGVEPDAAKLTDELDNQRAIQKYEKERNFIYNMKTAELRPAKFGSAIDGTPHFVQFLTQFRHQILQKQQRPYAEKVYETMKENLIKNRKPINNEFDNDRYMLQHDKWMNKKIQRQLCIYYVDPRSEEIVAKETRKFNIGKYDRDPKRPKMFPVTTNPSLFVECYEERDKDLKIFVKVRKIKELLYSKQEIATLMLTELVENPDEDLLSGVATLLQSQEDGLEWDWGREIGA